MGLPLHMSRRRSTFARSQAAVALLLSWQTYANAQACCAGTGTVTPGRLGLHEVALLGLQAKAATELGSFDAQGRYAGSPAGASELDLEQDFFGAVRVLNRGQVAVLVPLDETRRTAQGLSEFGGGLGDINLNLRYDFTLAGTSLVVPGIAALAGITFPTGKPPDAPDLRPLASDATGIGAYQANFGLAFEQAFGPWLVNATGIVAARTARTVESSGTTIHERLASQWTVLASVGYVLPSEAALAFSAAYSVEGDAAINGQKAPDSAHRLTTLTASGLLPLTDTWRLQGSLFVNPPVSGLSLNQTARGGLLITLVHSWI
jgi:hypothetical protein